MDFFIRDLGVVEIPLVDRRSDLDPQLPVLANQLPSLAQAEGLCRDLVDREWDSVLREKLPRLLAVGSPPQVIENRFLHAGNPVSVGGTSYHGFH